MIRRGSYQAEADSSIWAYETVSDLWPDMDPDSDYSDDCSREEEIKDRENLDYQEQEVVSASCRNPRRLRQCNQRLLIHLKSEI